LCASRACSDSGAHCSAFNAVAVDRCARSSRCSAGTPDSPVNYSGQPPIFPKVASSASSSLVHRTLSGAPDQGAIWDVFCSLSLNPFLVFLLVCCEPLAPVKLIISNKLVSPIICVGQFNHQNQLGKRCKPNSLSISPFLVIDANTNQSKYRSV
jgi:hypothetical protein